MREIKFRVWTGSLMEYRVVVGQFGAFYVAGLDPMDSASLSPANTIYSKETPVMQYTGLKDKNGKEIWEGDILKIPDGWSGDYHQKERLQVVSYEVVDGSQDAGFWISLPDGEGWSKCEVVGNIYENTDLLTIN